MSYEGFAKPLPYNIAVPIHIYWPATAPEIIKTIVILDTTEDEETN